MAKMEEVYREFKMFDKVVNESGIVVVYVGPADSLQYFKGVIVSPNHPHFRGGFDFKRADYTKK